MAAVRPVVICTASVSLVGLAIDDGTGHCRYWVPKAGVIAMSAVTETVAMSSGCARRHQNTASSTPSRATLVPYLATCTHIGSDQTGSAVGCWVTHTPAQPKVPMVGWLLVMCLNRYGNLSTGVPTVSGMVTKIRIHAAAPAAVAWIRRRQVGRAASNAGPNRTGQVWPEMAIVSRTPPAMARRAVMPWPPFSTTTMPRNANSRQNGSSWPCSLLMMMATGLQAYWKRRSLARPGEPPDAVTSLPTTGTSRTSQTMAGMRAVISQAQWKWMVAQSAAASGNV